MSPEYALDRQRNWLLEHFRADRVVVTPQSIEPYTVLDSPHVTGGSPMCRCWCCGKLLGKRALFVSQVDLRYGTRRSNLRPACREHADG